MDLRQQMRRLVVARTAFDTDGALRDGGQHFFRRQRRRYLVLKSHADEAGHREQRCVGDAVGKLRNPRVDIAAKRHHANVGPERPHLRGAAKRRGTDDRTLREPRKRRGFRRQERIARIGALQQAVDGQPVR